VATIFTYNHNPGGTKGLLFVGEKILVYRRDTYTTLFPLCLDLPGGGPEAHETPFQTFQREVTEEFNLHVRPKDIVFHIVNDPSDDGSISHFVVAKLPETEARNIVLGDEGTEYMLVTLQDYIDLPPAEIAFPLLQQNASLYARLHLSLRP
jgi:8-oxo-dGTP diphosphatase